jgi:outer membrane murein-binding lipoprotein Lpp
MADFKNNETKVFTTIDNLAKSMKSARENKKGGMKEAADAAEEIRKWQEHMWDMDYLED